ncbi:MAG: exopolysaccharide biosynthesis protein [Puniceicoccales bacterium]
MALQECDASEKSAIIMEPSSHTSLCEALSRFSKMEDRQDYSLGSILEAVNDKGFGVLLVVLALPSALPVPAAGYSTPFGLLIVTLGLQMLRGRHIPWLPEKASKMRLPRSLFRGMITSGMKFFGMVEHLIRPRMTWIAQPIGRRLVAVLVILMGLLMCLPIPGTNTVPAGVVFLVGISLSEEDGLFAVLAAVVGVFAVALYAAAIYFLVKFFQEYGWDAIDVFLERIKEFVKGLF